MEIEIKERLLSEADWKRVYDLLNKDGSVTPVHQKNVFFDTEDGTMHKKHIGMRLRFYEDKCLVTCKEPVLFADGIHRAKEIEEFIPKEVGCAVLATPAELPRASAVLRDALDRNVDGGSAAAGDKLVVFGTFENYRASFPFEGKVLELDKTIYDFGTRYEIEIECEDPESMKKKLIEFLDKNGVSHTASKHSKYACMFKKLLD